MCPPFFCEKSDKERLGQQIHKFLTSVRRIAFIAVIHHSAKVWVTYTEYIILGRSIVVKRPYELDQIFRI